MFVGSKPANLPSDAAAAFVLMSKCGLWHVSGRLNAAANLLSVNNYIHGQQSGGHVTAEDVLSRCTFQRF